ncbi:MAG: hypothetical protein E7534_03740 [Ruminococcaceae bacterium]|nr:hypothetical protein [Oscillospiraceae bacterium]MBQ2780018.1 hypothetical protein [Clostridia bacterium]
MKKVREFLFLFMPLTLLAVLPVVMFITNQTENAFVGNIQYLRLFLNDGVFWNAIFSTYCKTIGFSVLAAMCFALLCHFIKYIKSRKVFYPVSVVLTSVVAFFSTYMNRVNYFGLPTGVYDPQYFTSNTPPAISVSVYDILLALQIGFLTTFIFWLAETFILFIKYRKST